MARLKASSFMHSSSIGLELNHYGLEVMNSVSVSNNLLLVAALVRSVHAYLAGIQKGLEISQGSLVWVIWFGASAGVFQ